MSELGRWLRETREQRRLSLADVEADIKIRQRLLTALEQGNREPLPPSAYARGLVRKYASYLGLDPTLASEMFETEYSARVAAAPEPSVLAEPLYRRGADWSEILLGAGVLLLLIIVGAAVWQYSIVPLRQAPRQTGGVQVAAAATGVAPETPPETTPVSAPTAPTTAPATRTPVLEPTPAGTSVPTATLLPTYGPTNTPIPPTPAPSVPPTEVEVAVEITQPSWIQVTVDGRQVFAAILQPGQNRAWRGSKAINLRTGNAGGTIIFVNGQPLGTLGTSGAVVEREWQLAEGDVVMVTPEPFRRSP